jgi:hypothetical protein
MADPVEEVVPAHEGIPLNPNPLNPSEDAERLWEWRNVPIVSNGDAMLRDVKHVAEVEGFEFASVMVPAIGVSAEMPVRDRGACYVYRRKRRANCEAEAQVMATLQYQKRMLACKNEVDGFAIELHARREANPEVRW